MKEAKEENYGKEHNWIKLSLVPACIVSFVLAVGFGFLSGNLYNPTSKLFVNSTGAISDKYPTDITPAGWAFSIWGFIYVWQALWLLYSFVCLFRQTEDGYYLYLKPDFLNYGIFVCFLLNMWFIIGWLFLFGNEHLGWALLFLCLITFTLYLALFISHRKLNENEEKMRENNLKVDIWLVRLLLQNGIAFYATWVSIASNINFASYITWRLGASIEDAGTAALFLILAAIINYFVLENFVWRKYLQYTFSPWFVMIIAFIGSLNKNWNYQNPTRNNIITLVIMIIVTILFIIRIVLFWLYLTVLKKRFKGNLFCRFRDSKKPLQKDNDF